MTVGLELSSGDRTGVRTTLRVDPAVSTDTFLDRVRQLAPVDDIENCYDTTLSGETFAETVAPDGVTDRLAGAVEEMAVAAFSFKSDRQVSYMELGDSSLRERTETDERTVAIVYHEDGYAFVSGPGGRTASEGETVAERLFASEDTESVDVDESFLRWLVWRAHSGERLGPALDISRVTMARVVGGGPPEEFQLTGEDPLGSQQPRRFLERVRDGHRIDRLNGEFALAGFDLHGYITTYTGIGASPGESEPPATGGTEVLLGLLFCLRVVRLFEERSALPESERALPPEFDERVADALSGARDG